MGVIALLLACSEYDLQDVQESKPPEESTVEAIEPPEEVCDGIDNNDDGVVDEGFADTDYDGIADCVDEEECDGLDNDGDGLYDEGMPDSDFDGLVDCFDVEICDSLDNDGDGLVDEGMPDTDGDGYPDCQDVETCDGIDNDGDGLVDEDMPDTDSDGIPDCLDIEECDGLDNDGDGDVDEGMPDTDGDGTPDCTDPETCDGLDNDGDGLVDEGMPDTDGDGIVDCLDEEECDGIDNNGDGYIDEGFDFNGNGTPDCSEVDDCDGIDNDGDGYIDEDADSNGDGIGDCFQIATIFTYGFHANGSSICGSSTVLDREMQEIDYVLSGLGYSAAFFVDDRSETLSFGQLSHFSSIIYHNGGWMDHGSLSVVQALENAALMGKGLIFLGDDSAFHASGTQSQHGTSAMFDLMGFASYSSNGSAGTVTVSNSTHPVIDGPMGTVGSFSYISDIDDASAASGSDVLMVKGAAPAVIATEDGVSRRVTVNMRLNNSSDCPSGATSVPPEMETLFHNALLWVEWN
jgi:hypothetical protein